MTEQDKIIEMARQAGMIWMSGLNGSGYHINHPKTIEAFAKLVAAKEREACAKLVDDMWTGYGDLGAICSSAIRARGEI